MTTSYSLIKILPPGKLDIIGDIHGEIDSLRELLQQLGYDDDGLHPENRHLVFVGDYCDRGPDSPAVIALVSRLVKAKRASAILGNHELNLLRNDAKDGSGWYFDSQYEHDQEKFAPFKQATEQERKAIREFLLTLPIALEREDIRIVHAAWDIEAIAKVRANEGRPILELYEEWHQATQNKLNLREQFLAAMNRQGSGFIEREQAIRLFARRMGFARTGPVITEIGTSLIRKLLRAGRLHASGTCIRYLRANEIQ